MNKTLLLVLSAILFSPNVSADDLVLRVATLGYEDADEGPNDLLRLPSSLRKRIPGDVGGQDGVGDAEGKVLRFIETQIIPGNQFSASSRNSEEIIELRGSSTRDKESNLKIRLYYKYSKISAEAMEAIRLVEGDANSLRRMMKMLPGSSTEHTITLKPGDSRTLGEFFGVTEGVGKNKEPKKFSANRIVATLVDRDAAKQKSAEPSDQPKSR